MFQQPARVVELVERECPGELVPASIECDDVADHRGAGEIAADVEGERRMLELVNEGAGLRPYAVADIAERGRRGIHAELRAIRVKQVEDLTDHLAAGKVTDVP